MPDTRLIHDCSFATTKAVLEVFNLNDSEYREAFERVVLVIEAGYHALLEFKARETARLAKARPGNN